MLSATRVLLFILVASQPGEGTASNRSHDATSKRGNGNCPTMNRIWYYRDRLVAIATVTNTVVDPNFILLPSNELADIVCGTCLHSTNGELHVDLGLLAQELGVTEANITLWMSWELHKSWEEKCGGGSLTWIFDTEANLLSIVERPELVTVITEYDPINATSDISGGSGSRTHYPAPPLLGVLTAVVLGFVVYDFIP